MKMTKAKILTEFEKEKIKELYLLGYSRNKINAWFRQKKHPIGVRPIQREIVQLNKNPKNKEIHTANTLTGKRKLIKEQKAKMERWKNPTAEIYGVITRVYLSEAISPRSGNLIEEGVYTAQRKILNDSDLSEFLEELEFEGGNINNWYFWDNKTKKEVSLEYVKNYLSTT